MAFTGVAVVKRVSESLVRITGLSLAPGAAGTISLFEGAGEVKTPDNFEPVKYDTVTFQDSLELTHLPCVPINVVKTGTLVTDFLITLTNMNMGVTAAVAVQEAMFYGLTGQGGDYPGPIAAGDPIPFPQAGPAIGTIAPGGTNQFALPTTGMYRVAWSADFTAQSQLAAALNGVLIANTVSDSGVGTDEGTQGAQNNNEVLIDATAGDLLSIINAGGAALTVAGAGGDFEEEQAPSLVIEFIPTAPIAPTGTGPLEIYVRYH